MSVINAIRHVGKTEVPQDIKRRRRQVQETMRRMGTPVLVKHMYTARDVKNGIAEESPNFDDIYKQTRNADPLSHGIGFVSVEKSDDEWVSPEGELIQADASLGPDYVPAPKYRGFGPGYLIYMIQPDVPEDIFKLTETGVLIRTQNATAQAPWYPKIEDNDLIINVTIDRNENIIETYERYQTKMTNPVSMRGFDRRGRQERTRAKGNSLAVNQTFQMSLLPAESVLYNVETDR